jgi:hypothetical protein
MAEVVEPVTETEVSVVEKEDLSLTAMTPEAPRKKAYRTDAVITSATEAIKQETSSDDDENSGSVPMQAKEDTQDDASKDYKPLEQPARELYQESGNWIEDDKEMKERKTRTALVLSGIAGTNSAQNSTRTGILRRPTLSAAPAKTAVTQTEPGDSYGIPVSFGVGTKIGFGKRWSLGVGLNYTLMSRKFFGDYTKVEGGKITESIKSDIRNTQHYIGIPVNAYYDIVENRFMNFYAYAGGAVEKCVSDEYRVLAKDILHKESIKGLQASANLGIGVEFLLGKHLGAYVDPSVRYYFNCNQPKSIRTAQPLMLGFEMGLRIRL